MSDQDRKQVAAAILGGIIVWLGLRRRRSLYGISDGRASAIAASADGSIGGSSATACGCCPITGLMKQASYGNYSQAAPIGIIEPTIVTPPPPGSTPGGAFGFAPPSVVEFLPVTGAPGAHQTFRVRKEFGRRPVRGGAHPIPFNELERRRAAGS